MNYELRINQLRITNYEKTVIDKYLLEWINNNDKSDCIKIISADLSNAVGLESAKLKGAKLKGAKLEGTKLPKGFKLKL